MISLQGRVGHTPCLAGMCSKLEEQGQLSLRLLHVLSISCEQRP